MNKYRIVDQGVEIVTMDAINYFHAHRKMDEMKKQQVISPKAKVELVKKRFYLIKTEYLKAARGKGAEVFKQGASHCVVLAYDLDGIPAMGVPQGMKV